MAWEGHPKHREWQTTGGRFGTRPRSSGSGVSLLPPRPRCSLILPDPLCGPGRARGRALHARGQKVHTLRLAAMFRAAHRGRVRAKGCPSPTQGQDGRAAAWHGPVVPPASLGRCQVTGDTVHRDDRCSWGITHRLFRPLAQPLTI